MTPPTNDDTDTDTGTDTGPLDAAHGVMQAAPEDDGARMRYYAALADTELCLLLRDEARGADIAPMLADVDGTQLALAFDTEERLAGFAGTTAHYAALSGRVLAAMLADAGLGLAINPDSARAFLVPPDGLRWLLDTLATPPSEAQGRLRAIHPPAALPDTLLQELATRLTRAAGLADAAYLAEAEYDSGARMALLAITGCAPQAEAALAKSVAEALTFSGVEAGALDVIFLPGDDPRLATLARQGLRFDIPDPTRPHTETPTAPGTDPDRPPRLR